MREKNINCINYIALPAPAKAGRVRQTRDTASKGRLANSANARQCQPKSKNAACWLREQFFVLFQSSRTSSHIPVYRQLDRACPAYTAMGEPEHKFAQRSSGPWTYAVQHVGKNIISSDRRQKWAKRCDGGTEEEGGRERKAATTAQDRASLSMAGRVHCTAHRSSL